MKDSERIQALADDRIRQAHDALRASQILIDAGLTRDAISRAYYAIFYAVLALLVTRRLGTSRHSGALALFNREFIKTGMVAPEMGRLARRAFDRRLEADYAELVDFTKVEAEETLARAHEFVDVADSLLRDILDRSRE